jgi:hypothetical protein
LVFPVPLTNRREAEHLAVAAFLTMIFCVGGGGFVRVLKRDENSSFYEGE